MADTTKIAWTESTFNPWRGCVKVSDGCKFCYAEAWSKRTGKQIWGADAAREHAAEAYWKKPVTWNEEAAAAGDRRLVFCSSLADVCEDRDDLLEPRARLMRLIEATPSLVWLLLTKRPENFVRFFGGRWGQNWPRNVWAMTTVENEEMAQKRLPHLLRVPALILGVSYEPALGPVNFRPWFQNLSEPTRGVDWVIAGGESGSGARPFLMDWARDARDACRENGAAFFMKQMGARAFAASMRQDMVAAMPEDRIRYSDPKGGDPEEWPEDLRVRMFP